MDIPDLPDHPRVALTGHRPGARAGGGHGKLRDGSWVWVRRALPKVYADIGPSVVWSGGALGFDQLGAWLAIQQDIPVRFALPFDGFDARWPQESRDRLQQLLARTQKPVMVGDPGYAPWKLHARNDFLLDNADAVIALWDGNDGGGTASAVTKALDRNLPVVHLDPHRRTARWIRRRTPEPMDLTLLLPPDDGAPPDP